MSKLRISLLDITVGVCRLSPQEDIPSWARQGKLFSITNTREELSVLCEEKFIPAGLICERDWKVLKVEGPLDFTLIGILSRLSGLLAEAGISIFALSTYDTDYILVKNKDIDRAVETLRNNDYEIIEG